jgi:Ca-activated chloride channel homolog
MRHRVVLVLALVAAAAACSAGSEPFGRMALAVGGPSLAARLLEDPAWQGVALYRSSHFAAADEAFRKAGSRVTFNRGNSLAKLGRYEEAVAYYDAALFRDPRDEDAQVNRAIVSALVPPTVGEHREGKGALPPGREAAAGENGTPPTQAGSVIQPVDYERSKKPVDAMSIAAGREWLATLADEPGQYLKLRIAAEHQRRTELGIAAPEANSPW